MDLRNPLNPCSNFGIVPLACVREQNLPSGFDGSTENRAEIKRNPKQKQGCTVLGETFLLFPATARWSASRVPRSLAAISPAVLAKQIMVLH